MINSDLRQVFIKLWIAFTGNTWYNYDIIHTIPTGEGIYYERNTCERHY